MRPCCRRRQMTVWLRVWMIQTLPCGVSRFRGQNTLLLCLHVRRSGLCCQPDPPVLPTRSVFRISTTLPEGSSTSANVPRPLRRDDFPIRGTKRDDTSTPCYVQILKSGDLLCTGGNPAYGLLPLPIQSRVIAGCRESLQFRRAVHVRTMSTVPEELVFLDGYPYDLMMEFVGD